MVPALLRPIFLSFFLFCICLYFFNEHSYSTRMQRKVRNQPLGQNIQEWTKYNLRKTAFKNLKEYVCFKQTILLQTF